MKSNIYFCHVCKKETDHYEFHPHFISDVDVCTECGTLTGRR